MQDRYLRTGIFLAPFHALNENPTLAIERDMELVEHLDRLNYHEAWIGEHHSGGFEIIACPEMFIAGAVQRTRNIRLGTGVVSLPYHHPFTLASRMMQLDHMMTVMVPDLLPVTQEMQALCLHIVGNLHDVRRLFEIVTPAP